MLNVTDLRDYQKTGIIFQCSNDYSMLWLDMGLGKTVITLTSISHLISTGYLKNVIIVAPIRVIRLVWRQEALKWEHTKHLRFSLVLGTRDQRVRALLQKADIYLINYENIKWLGEMLHKHSKNGLSFDGLVWDEISKMKNSTSKRCSSIRGVIHEFKWRVGLTGTPAGNGYKDLHGQYLMVDNGLRLGTSKTAFRSRFYMKKGPYQEVAYDDAESTIKRLIGDITLEMSAKDYNPLPDMIVNDVYAEMPPSVKSLYDRLEKELFVCLDNGTDVEVFNQAALTNKCLQFANGAVYPVSGVGLWEVVHDLKLDALEDIIDEAQGKPILCAYSYRSDAERIMTRFKDIDPINLTMCKNESSLIDAMNKWENGECRLMIGHPASMGHGIDGLQKTGRILVWFGLNWSLELYDQFNARLRRQGQDLPVICHRILIRDTLDSGQAIAIENKAKTQSELRSAIKEYRRSKKTASQE